MSNNNDKNTEMLLYLEPDEAHKKELLLHYKPLITPFKQNIKNIESFLINNFAAIRIDFMQLSNGFRNHVLYNINAIIHEHKLNISISNKDISVYVLPENENTKDYYLHSYIPICIGKDIPKSIQGKICIILEPHTEYIECGSAKLFLELALGLGISQYDYDNNTDKLLCYISRYKLYCNKKY